MLPIFYYSLNSKGILLLGNAETIGDRSDLFSPIHGKLRIFKKSEELLTLETIAITDSLKKPSNIKELSTLLTPSTSFQSAADRLLLEHYTAPIIITNEEGDLLYMNGPIEKYLEPAAGKTNVNLFAMLNSDLSKKLEKVFDNLRRLKTVLLVSPQSAKKRDAAQNFEMIIQFLEEQGPLHGFILIQFQDQPITHSHSFQKMSKIALDQMKPKELSHYLRQLDHEATLTQSKMQTIQSQLRFSNEELQSTNEELQSTIEELTTSKEEMQSVNEELQTVNSELLTKVDQLSQSTAVMNNFLDSTDIATLFLNNQLKILRFTPQATLFFKLISSDVGRPITDLASVLDYGDLEKDLKRVLRKHSPIEKTIQDSKGSQLHLRILPYRTIDARVDGVVMTFNTIPEYLRLDKQAQNQQPHRALKTQPSLENKA